MIVIATTLIGGAYGAFLARRRGGTRADIAQFAVVLAIIGALAGLFVTIMIERLA